MTGKYKIADMIIDINSIYSSIHSYCSDYSVDGPSCDFSVTISQPDIDFEKGRGNDINKYSDNYLETLAVYRKIAEKMPDYDTLLFHGSAVAVDEKCYLFTAPSGTGKSTHARLWREYLGDRAVMVNDDKPLIHVSENGSTVYGTPWNGKHRLGNNIAVPLKAICLISRSAENSIKQISPDEAYPILLAQTYRPYSMTGMEKTLTLLDKLRKNTFFWKLECNMDIKAAETSYNAMKG